MAPLNTSTGTGTGTSIPAILNQNLAKVSIQEEPNMNASEEDYRDSLQSPLIQKQQQQQEEEAVQEEEPAINHHNAIMSALRRRVNRSKDKFRDGDASTSRSSNSALRNRLYDRQSKKDQLKRLHLIGQHYKIDQNNRALLPGVPKYDEDLARDAHDFFNLICLVSE